MGSEMCIRDRLITEQLRLEEVLGYGGTIDAYKRMDFAWSGMMNSCLLYTSDAADDLLCVDLGGRRIIKKKQIIVNNDLQPITHRVVSITYT